MEQSITMLVAKRCSETREDPAAAAAILAQTPFAIAEVVENAHVPDDELLIEMREMNGEVRQGLAQILVSHRELLDSHDKVLDSNRKMQQGHATLIEEVQKLTKWERARRLKNAHMEDNEIELDFVEVEPFAGGGQGSVHKAEYGGETVCLKKFLLVGVGAQSARDKIVSSFKKEVGIMDKLRKHPRTVDFVGICTTDASFLGIVTQYLPNGSLRSVLDDARGDAITPKIDKRSDAITPKIQLNWAKDIAIGMAYLHKEGVLHRDLKSQNVLLTHEWRCKISDFGVSQCRDLKTAVTRQSIRGDAKRTPGTVLFKAPEAFDFENPFSEKSDVYSYAIVLWEIWDRGEPWDGLNESQIMYAVCMHKKRPKVPAPEIMSSELSELMSLAWSHDAAARPDFKDIVTQLDEFALELNDPVESGIPVLCSCVQEASKRKNTEWTEASAVSIAYYEKLGRDPETLKKVRDSANERALIQIGRKNKESGIIDVVSSTHRPGPMKKTHSNEIYYRVTLKGRGLL